VEAAKRRRRKQENERDGAKEEVDGGAEYM
jgi:hypothetical protein